MSSESEKLFARLHSKLSLLNEEEKSRVLAQLKEKVGAQKETSAGVLSHAQLRLWILDQLSQCSFLYHVPLVIALQNDINLVQLESALKLLVQENPVLSSCFLFENESVTQSQARECDFKIQTIFLDEELPYLLEISEFSPLAHFFLDPLNKSKAPLFRIAYLKTPMQSMLLICFHHLILDGWSVPLIVDRLNYYYHSCTEQTLKLIPTQGKSYSDFIEWEHQNPATKSKEGIDYWLNRLARKSFIVDLATDYPRPVLKTNRGKTLFKSISKELVLSLHSFASKEGVSINHVLLCAYQLILSRYSGQDEITLGIPVTGRSHSCWYNTIGLFVNTCLHSISIDHQRTISEQLNQVKKHFLNDMAHADEPFDEVIKALYTRQQVIPTQVFNILYNFIQIKKQDSTAVVTLANNYCALPVSKFDVSLHVYASESTLDLLVEFSTELFQEETINYMFDYLMRILETMPRYHQATLSQWIWAMSGDYTPEGVL